MRFHAEGRLVAVWVVACVLLAGCAGTGSSAKPATAPAAAKVQKTPATISMAEVLDNPQMMAVLRKHAPNIADHPQISMARGMTLADVAGYPEAGLDEKTLAAIVADINKL